MKFRAEVEVFQWDGSQERFDQIKSAAPEVTLIKLFGGHLRVISPASAFGAFQVEPDSMLLVRAPNVVIGMSQPEYDYLFEEV